MDTLDVVFRGVVKLAVLDLGGATTSKCPLDLLVTTST